MSKKNKAYNHVIRTGLNLEMEALAQSPKDWKLKGKTISEIELDNTVIKLDPTKIYDYLPIGELQRGANDYMDCASRAPINDAETIFNYAYNNELIHPENMRWLEHTGYIVDSGREQTMEGSTVGKKKVEFSDRYIACKSGTTNSGNSLKAPVEAIHNWGLIPKKMFKGSPTMYRNEYLNPSKITSAMEDTGKEFKRRFPVQFYKVYKHEFEKCLPTSPIDVAGHAWSRPDNNGVYPLTNAPINHAFMYFATPKYKIFDNYIDRHDGDWIKRLAENYNLLHYGFWMIFRERKIAQVPSDGVTISDATEKPKTIHENNWLTFWEFWKWIPKKIGGLFKK